MDTTPASREPGHYTLSDLEDLPTLSQGQAADLKIDDGQGTRVWLSRMTREDGAEHDHAVEIEVFDGTRWNEHVTYPS